MKVLCVAEKPSIAKAIANALAGGMEGVRTRSIRGNQYVKNYDLNFTFTNWGPCNVTVTSVLGHLRTMDFDKQAYGWRSCDPSVLLELRTPTIEFVPDNMRPVANNIGSEARNSDKLYIWTDCDREGEYIGSEIIKVATEANGRLQMNRDIKRAIFNNTDTRHLFQAANRPVNLDVRQVSAVEARMELDLRTGAAYTRFQTFLLQQLAALSDKMVSYGACQFPTLGFVVDRYKKRKNFKPEKFWYLEVKFKRDNQTVVFNWERYRLFDRLCAVAIFERCLQSYEARVIKVETKDTNRRKPLPLTTVELQKQGSKNLRMTAKKVLDVAERLYNKGYLSYPRTETNRFAPEIDLKALIAKQRNNPKWNDYVNRLENQDQYSEPRKGNKDDKAHPPIHPVNSIPATLSEDEKKVYEFVTRHFLACCGKDAIGKQTKVTIDWVGERFSATGIRIIAKNFLDVYPYIKWTDSELCDFTPNEKIHLSETNLQQGATTAPQFITEPELIALMDANGIGTDATMADHIETIQSRQYVGKTPGTGRGPSYIIPTPLGMALVEAYDSMNFDLSLTKPFLRKDTEAKLQQICDGTLTKQVFVEQTLRTYRETFQLANDNSRQLYGITQRYLSDDH